MSESEKSDVQEKEPENEKEKEKDKPTSSTSPAINTLPSSKTKIQKAPEIPPFESRNWLIYLLYIRKDWDGCQLLIKEQLAETGHACEYALYISGLMSRQQGRIQESLDHFQQCALMNPMSVVNLKQVARSLFLLGRHKAAIDVYTEALKRNPNDWEIYHNLGVCSMHLKDYNKAKEYLKHTLSLGKHVVTYTMLGKIYLMLGDIANAIDVFKQAVEVSPENTDLLTTMGLLYIQSGQFQKAFEHLGNALTYDPCHVRAILAVGSIMQAHADYDVALSKYRVAANVTPESAPVWNNIGMAFFGKKKFIAAISCLKRANYLAPFEYKILYNLGLLHLHTRQYASAFHFLSASIQLKPKLGQLYMLLGITLTNLDDPENAIKAYEEALKLDEMDPMIALNFSVFYYKQNSRSKAAKMMSELERRIIKLKERGVTNINAEVKEMAIRLAPALHVGTDLASSVAANQSAASKPEPVPISQSPTPAPPDSDQSSIPEEHPIPQPPMQHPRPKPIDREAFNEPEPDF